MGVSKDHEGPLGYSDIGRDMITQMRTVFLRLLVVLSLLLIALGLGQAQLIATPRYRIIDLGHHFIFGGPERGAAINSKGDVAASIDEPNAKPDTYGGLLCVWHNGDPKDFTISKIANFTFCGISDNGAVAGNLVGESPSAAVWQNGKLVLIRAKIGLETTAFGCNDMGQVVGVSERLSSFIWQDGNFTRLKAPGGYCEAGAISDSGDVAGVWINPVNDDLDNRRIFIYRKGKIDIVQAPPGMLMSINGINNKDQVVGNYTLLDGKVLERAFLWQDGKVADLPPPRGKTVTRARDINDLGQIVGGVDDGDMLDYDDDQAMLWENGKDEDLNTLIAPSPDWKLTEAYGINDKGEIVCQGWYRDREWHVVLLVPTDSEKEAPAK